MSEQLVTYEAIIERAASSPEFRDGLRTAAAVCREQGRDDGPPCPSQMAAVYLDRLAEGKRP